MLKKRRKLIKNFSIEKHLVITTTFSKPAEKKTTQSFAYFRIVLFNKTTR